VVAIAGDAAAGDAFGFNGSGAYSVQ
jgi:hypothetical protein